MRSADTSRSYIVSIPSGLVRINSKHLVAIPEREESQDDEQNVVPELPAPALVRDPIITRSKTGTKIACPVRIPKGRMAYLTNFYKWNNYFPRMTYLPYERRAI